MKLNVMQKVARIALIVAVGIMLLLFFSNDFGLVDIHKASIVVAIGVDAEDEGYAVTAQAAIPTPANGEGSAAYTQVTGRGATVAEALDDINSRTGFYPKLTFCNLVILGESCIERELFTTLDYFYRNDYVPLTALVAMCRGSAEELLKKKPADGGMSSSAIQRAMSEELKNSANSSTVNLKLIAQYNGSRSNAAYMPLIEWSSGAEGGSATVFDGADDDVAAAAPKGGGNEKTSASEQFVCARTVAFRNGRYAGTLTRRQAVALNFIHSAVRLAVINVRPGGNDYTVGLKSVNCNVSAEGVGQPVLKVKLSALANVQSSTAEPSADGSANSHLVADDVLRAVENELKGRMASLMEFCVNGDCDLFFAKRLFYEHDYKLYMQYKDDFLKNLKVEYDIKIKSVR